MRVLAVAVMLGIVGTSSLAFADPWRAQAALDPESPALCRQADVSKLVFDFATTGSELSGRTNEGHAFSAPVALDGSVSTTIVVPFEGRDFAVDLTGNARSRALEIFSRKYACRFRLAPLD